MRCYVVFGFDEPSIGFSFTGPVFRRHILNGQIDHDEIWAQAVSACDLFFVMYSYKENQNFMVMSVVPAAGQVREVRHARYGGNYFSKFGIPLLPALGLM